MCAKSLKDIKKIYFIGIGGTSMSGLALISHTNGFEVLGSDMRPCSYTEKLEAKGIKVNIGHHAENIPKDCDLVVYSAAIHEDNPEMVQARAYGIECMDRSYFLGMLSLLYPTTIAVSGTHGKTTTSSLTALMLLNAGLDPSVSIGGTLEAIGGNSRVGKSEYFVIEACEFVDSFLHTQHKIGTILNIDADHLDYFTGGLAQIEESFDKFARILPEGGLLIANLDDEHVRNIMKDDALKANITTFGFDENADYCAKNVSYDAFGKPTFDVYKKGEYFATFSLNIPGAHNVSDALSVVVCADHLGIDTKVMDETFKQFGGAKRRFEFKGEVNGIKVFEDYAHHPTELKVTIDSALNYDHNKLWVVFQPHTYSRTFLLKDEFIDAVANADEIIFNDIYSDREANDWNIYSEDLANGVNEKYNKDAIVISKFEDIVDHIAKGAVSGDIVLVAGSQSINAVAQMLVDKLSE